MSELVEFINSQNMTVALQVGVAAALVMLGRRLYWLFVAGIGFVVTMELATAYLQMPEEWMTLALAIVAGFAGALFAVFLQKLAVALAGFAAAAYFAYVVAENLGFTGAIQNVAVLVVGVFGAIFASALFDWALILLSSITGAFLLVDAFALDDTTALVVMVIVGIAGVSIQANMLQRDRSKDG